MEPACVTTWNSTEHDPAAAGLWNTPQKSSKSLAKSGGSYELFKDQKLPEKSSTWQNASSKRDRREPVPGKNPYARNPS